MRRLTAVAAFSCLWTLVQGQTTTPVFRDFGFERDSSAWLTSENAAGLTRFSSANISQATIYGELQRGGWVDYSQSPKATEAGASVESYFRLSPKVVVYGRMAYDNFSGRDMAGSVFIHPERMPFDVVEDSLTNLGRKHLDSYELTGAVGVALWKWMSVGVRADYTSANYAKYKDLRHKNLLMDLKVAPGLRIDLGKSLSLGANYLYRRQTESVDFDTYGKTDRTYFSLVSYAAFIGRLEHYGVDGYTNANNTMPWLDERHGVGVQLETRFLPTLSWFNHFSFSHRKGYYGRRSPYTIRMADHDGDTYTWTSRLDLPHLKERRWRHHLDFSLDAEKLCNWTTTYREQTNESGSKYYAYYTPVKTADKVFVDGSVAYTAHILSSAQSVSAAPLWTLHAGYTWLHRKQTAYVYPYYRRQRLDNASWSASLTRNIVFGRSMLTLTAGVRIGEGSGDAYEDGTFIEPSDKQSQPPQMETWLYREYEYLVAAQRELSFSARYSFVVPRTSFPVYVGFDCLHRKAAHPQYREYLVGTDHTRLRLSVGSTF